MIMCKHGITLLWICLVVVILFDLTAAQSAESKATKQVTCTGKVIDDQDRPMAGVKVSLHEMVYDEATYSYDPKKLGEMQTGSDGAFSFEETIIDNQYRYGYIIADKEDLALGFDNWSMRDGDRELAITMGPSKELAGIVVDEKDVPVPDAQVIVSTLVLGEGRERLNLTGLVIPRKLTTSTNDKGQFIFNCIPAGATAEFMVSKPGKATLSTYKRTGESYQKLNFSEGQKDIKLLMSPEANIEGITLEKNSGKPVGGIQLRYTSGQELGYFRTKSIITKTDGTFRIGALCATQYTLELVSPSNQLPEWVAERVEVFAEAGKTKSGIKIELSKGGVLEVKVTDAVDKKPVEQVSVSVNQQVNSRYIYGRSDKNGLAPPRGKKTAAAYAEKDSPRERLALAHSSREGQNVAACSSPGR